MGLDADTRAARLMPQKNALKCPKQAPSGEEPYSK